MMIITYKYKFYKNKKNKNLINTIELSSEVYNHGIRLVRDYYRVFNKTLGAYKLAKHIARIKRLNKYKHWNKLNAQSIQEITSRIERGYKLFFLNKRKKHKTSTPKFKSRLKYKSFTLQQNGYYFLGGNRIKIMGRVYKYSKSRELDGTVKRIIVKRDRIGDLYLFVVLDVDWQYKRVMTGKIAGFDFGLKTFLISNTGEKIKSPLFFKKHLREIINAHKQLDKKKKGSNNRNRARLNLVRIYKLVSNKKIDSHMKLAHKLALQYDIICLEDIHMTGMRKRWGRKTDDISFGIFKLILQYQCKRYGSRLVKINKWFPSTKTCHICGEVNNNLTLKDRYWTCVCGEIHDRDINAAKNILMEGASSIGLEDVRLLCSNSCLNPEFHYKSLNESMSSHVAEFSVFNNLIG